MVIIFNYNHKILLSFFSSSIFISISLGAWMFLETAPGSRQNATAARRLKMAWKGEKVEPVEDSGTVDRRFPDRGNRQTDRPKLSGRGQSCLLTGCRINEP